MRSENFESLTNNFKNKEFPSAFEYVWSGRNTCLTPNGESGYEHRSIILLFL